jgi:uncharacterized protein YjbI with pentapeptide repeats
MSDMSETIIWRDLTLEQRADILQRHAKWLRGEGGERADLRGADLVGAFLRGAILRGADLSRSDLRGEDLSLADLRRADMRGADMRGADLQRADMDDAFVAHAYMRGAYLVDAHLRGAALSCVDLSWADLSGADLTGADLRGADLSCADLSGTDLRGADMRGANTNKADLRGALGGGDLGGGSPPVSNAERAAQYRAMHPDVPFVPHLDRQILAAIAAGGELDMSDWHTCATTHCRAGWAIALAGEAGRQLESRIGPRRAGAAIYRASTGRSPNFFVNDETAMKDIRACAAEDAQP